MIQSLFADTISACVTVTYKLCKRWYLKAVRTTVSMFKGNDYRLLETIGLTSVSYFTKIALFFLISEFLWMCIQLNMKYVLMEFYDFNSIERLIESIRDYGANYVLLMCWVTTRVCDLCSEIPSGLRWALALTFCTYVLWESE